MSRLRTIAATLVAGLYRAYFATLRVRMVLPDGTVTRPRDYPYGAEIFALCERDTLTLAGTLRRGFTVLVAHGRDGDWAAAAFAAMGCRVVRGASERGGTAALVTLISELQESTTPLGLVVDGPLGPAGQAKPGAVLCALRTRRPLRAYGVAARHALVFPNTWSGIFLPWPFTSVVIVVDHMEVPMPTDVTVVAVLTEELTSRLARAQAAATGLVRETR